jgi:hypothetical protein
MFVIICLAELTLLCLLVAAYNSVGLFREGAKKAKELWLALPRCERCGAVMASVAYHTARCKGRKGINVGVHAFQKGQRRW